MTKHAEATRPSSDTELLTLFRHDSERAWKFFIEKYADTIFSHLRSLGFDYDQTMERFVYICEKLCEQDFRRLKTIRYAGRSGDLTPWVRQVTQRLSINWVWSVEGRKRLFKSIARLPAHEQRIFELYFWRGFSPSGVYERLLLEGRFQVGLPDVFDALDRIFSRLSAKKLWRLMSNLARTQHPLSLDEIDEETGIGLDPKDTGPSPEEAVIQKEAETRMNAALNDLSPKERLVIQFRYEEGLAVKDIAQMLHTTERDVKHLLKTALAELKRTLK